MLELLGSDSCETTARVLQVVLTCDGGGVCTILRKSIGLKFLRLKYIGKSRVKREDSAAVGYFAESSLLTWLGAPMPLQAMTCVP